MTFALHLRLAVAAALVCAPLAAKAATLDDVKAQGIVKCGVAPLREGFSVNDGQGNWSGIDADFCRAIAAAVFDDPKAVLFLLGTEMDYQATKLSSGFVFNNPNQTSACGCGESVAITPAADAFSANA